MGSISLALYVLNRVSQATLAIYATHNILIERIRTFHNSASESRGAAENISEGDLADCVSSGMFRGVRCISMIGTGCSEEVRLSQNPCKTLRNTKLFPPETKAAYKVPAVSWRTHGRDQMALIINVSLLLDTSCLGSTSDVRNRIHPRYIQMV